MFEGFLFTFNDAGSARAPSRRDYMADSVGRPAHWLAQAPSLSSLSVWFLFFFHGVSKGPRGGCREGIATSQLSRRDRKQVP